MSTTWRIKHLIDARETLPLLTQWFIEEWTLYYGPEGPGNAERDLIACCHHNELPLAVVALNQDDDVLGTAALKTESVGSERGVEPWLAALLVGKDHRNQGVGTALVETIEQEADRLGYPVIYTSAANERVIGRRGWKASGTTESLKGPITIYHRVLHRT